MFDNGNRQMRLVIDQSSNVVFGHLRQLLLEDAFKAGKDDIAFSRIVIINDSELDYAVLFFDDGRLFRECDRFGGSISR